MNLDASFFEEEIRSGFPVTEKRKKIWAAELRILEKFDEVCQKHNLTYFAYFGTLLGAARHQGFIPWDDDIDLAMFRNDYEKFQAIAPSEFSDPWFFQNSYTDRQIWAISKIRDSRTTAIEFRDLKELNQGIYIDIFPLDDVPDDESAPSSAILEMQRELWLTIVSPDVMQSAVENGTRLLLGKDILLDLLKMNPRQRFKQFEAFCHSHFGKTGYVNFIIEKLIYQKKSVPKEFFQDIVYLPFENLRIPVPAGYDQILTLYYGNWHQFVQGGSAHEDIILEPDIPYTEYFARYLQEP